MAALMEVASYRPEVICRCGESGGRGRVGFSRIGEWWVCNKCRLPTYLFYCGSIRRNSHVQTIGESEVGLIFFRGGPYDGKAYETEALMGKQKLMAGIDEYDWTPEKVTSQQTGATAQVWVHRGGVNRAEDGGPTTADAPAATSSTEDAATSVDTTSASPATSASVDDSTSSERASTPSPARSSSSNGTAVTQEYLQSLNLRERREALTNPKASRKVVSDATGLPQSKVYGIETGEGKRIKSDEVDKYLAYITERESANASAHA